MRDLLINGLEKLEINNISPQAVDKLIEFSQLLIEKNTVMNLTAITEPFDVATKHFLDSASLLKFIDISDKKVCDIGCGAGFPSVPLKILSPSTDMTMVDSLRKRIDFISDCCNKLEIEQGSNPTHARAEEFASANREQFDFAFSRAVSNLNILAELCFPLLKVGGSMVCMKSINCDAELEGAKSAFKTLGAGEITTHDITIPFTDITHRIIIIKKIKSTPVRFPRKWAKIQINPL